MGMGRSMCRTTKDGLGLLTSEIEYRIDGINSLQCVPVSTPFIAFLPFSIHQSFESSIPLVPCTVFTVGLDDLLPLPSLASRILCFQEVPIQDGEEYSKPDIHENEPMAKWVPWLILRAILGRQN